MEMVWCQEHCCVGGSSSSDSVTLRGSNTCSSDNGGCGRVLKNDNDGDCECMVQVVMYRHISSKHSDGIVAAVVKVAAATIVEIEIIMAIF